MSFCLARCFIWKIFNPFTWFPLWMQFFFSFYLLSLCFLSANDSTVHFLISVLFLFSFSSFIASSDKLYSKPCSRSNDDRALFIMNNQNSGNGLNIFAGFDRLHNVIFKKQIAKREHLTHTQDIFHFCLSKNLHVFLWIFPCVVWMILLWLLIFLLLWQFKQRNHLIHDHLFLSVVNAHVLYPIVLQARFSLIFIHLPSHRSHAVFILCKRILIQVWQQASMKCLPLFLSFSKWIRYIQTITFTSEEEDSLYVIWWYLARILTAVNAFRVLPYTFSTYFLLLQTSLSLSS